MQIVAIKLGTRGYPQEIPALEDEPFVIRYAEASDIPLINRVRTQAFPQHLPSYALNHIPESEHGDIVELDRHYLLAFDRHDLHEAIGMISFLELPQGTGFIGQAFVLRNHTGKMVATSLTRRAEEELIKAQCSSIIMQIHRESSWGNHIQNRLQYKPAPGDTTLINCAMKPPDGFLIYRKDVRK